jgi:excisionase family DNA binding protein
MDKWMALLDYAAAARFLCVPKGTLYSMVHKQQIPFIRIAPRIVRFDEAVLRSWLAARAVNVRELKTVV